MITNYKYAAIMKRGDVFLLIATFFFLLQSDGLGAQALHPHKPPHARFKAHKKKIRTGKKVHFTDLSSHHPTSWHWFFEGGYPAESTMENPHNVKYFQEGFYDVKLIVTNDYGSDTLIKYDYIEVKSPKPPEARFHACRKHLFPGESTKFKDRSKHDPTSWSWYFEGGEPSVSTDEDPENIVYHDGGSYDVTLIVSNASGFDTLTKTDYIVVCDTVICETPIAAFEESATEIMVGQGLAFFDMSENAPEEWYWIFEGAQPGTSTGEGPMMVVYDTIGIFDVTLIVVNECGADTLVKENYINVVEELPLRSDFYADKTSIFDGEVVHFTDLSAGDPTFWVWEIEGASPSITYSQNPTVIFNIPGIYKVSLSVQKGPDTDVEVKEGYVSVGEEQLLLPPGWDFVLTPSQHVIAVPIDIYPNILGFPLEPGDHIGVFYRNENNETKCAGAEIWNGETNIAVVALGDSPYTNEKDGFSFGEEFHWKIYSWGNQREHEAITHYNMSLTFHDTFYPLGLSALTSLAAIGECSVMLPEGWSGLSSPVNPLNPDLNVVLEPIIDQMEMITNFYGMNWPAAGINTLFEWDNLSGYNIKMNDNVSLTFTGASNGEEEVLIEEGWNYLPVPVPCEKDVFELLGDNVDNVRLIRETSGFKLFWPEFGFYTLENLEPGQSYLVLADEEFDIVFSACDGSYKQSFIAQENSKATNNNWNVVQATNAVHTLAIHADALSQLQIGDQIGVFTENGYCAGFDSFSSEGMALSVFADDISTEAIDGFSEEETMQLLLYRPDENRTYELAVEYDHSNANQQWFSSNGISVINKLKFSSTGYQVADRDGVKISANPGDGHYRITGISDIKQISIISLTGKKVLRKAHDGSSSTQIDIANQPPGVYFLSLEGAGNPIVKKLIQQN